MKKLRLLLALCVAGFLFSTNVMAQDGAVAGQAVTYTLPAMAIVDIEGIAPALTFVVPTEAGDAIAPVSNSATWLNYTSVIATGLTNKVSVALNKAMPVSTTLKVTAAADVAGGNGTVGAASAQITLSTAAQVIISTIGSCYTGTGTAKGHNLTYEWSVNAAGYATLVSNTTASDVTVTYTIAGTL